MEKMKLEWVSMQFSLVKYRDTVSKHQINIYSVGKNYFDSEYQLRNIRRKLLLIHCGMMESAIIPQSLGKHPHYYRSFYLDLSIWITCNLHIFILRNL